MRVVKSKIDWSKALDDLLPQEYYILHILYYKDIPDVKDESILDYCTFSYAPYKRYKSGLIDKGYLKVVQVGRHKYKYILGNKAVDMDNIRFEVKDMVNDMVNDYRILNNGDEPNELDIREFYEYATEKVEDGKLLDSLGIDI